MFHGGGDGKAEEGEDEEDEGSEKSEAEPAHNPLGHAKTDVSLGAAKTAASYDGRRVGVRDIVIVQRLVVGIGVIAQVMVICVAPGGGLFFDVCFSCIIG